VCNTAYTQLAQPTNRYLGVATMPIEDQINQHYDRKINLLQDQLDAVNQEMAALDSAHNAVKETLDGLLIKSKARARAATEKRQKLQAEYYKKYGHVP
jgi:demethoxyubiquinone hydroxylase (CLK1/Coq7/Cat5 family)